MTMTIQAIKLTGHERLVSGTDARGNYGEAVICGAQWDHLTQRSMYDTAVAAYDEALQEFLAPIKAAAEAFDAAVTAPELDPLHYVVLDEGVDATSGRPREVVELDHSSVILRAIEQGLQDRLLWVGGTNLVLTAAPVTVASVTAQDAVVSETVES